MLLAATTILWLCALVSTFQCYCAFSNQGPCVDRLAVMLLLICGALLQFLVVEARDVHGTKLPPASSVNYSPIVRSNCIRAAPIYHFNFTLPLHTVSYDLL